MKELSIEQKAKAYDEALKVLKEKFSDKEVCGLDKSVLQKLFPQLKESEDEKIRKALIGAIRNNYTLTGYINHIPTKDILAWLEKQGGQKPADKDEPKFHEGEWIVKNDDSPINIDYSHCKITKVENGNYTIESIYGYKGYNTFETFEKDYHLWTIQDAKDGDVLIDKSHGRECPFIFKETKPSDIKADVLNPLTVLGYCGIGGAGFTKGCGWGDTANCTYYPATKEQRDLLFQKMKKTGYIWDSENKKLKGEEIDNIHNYLYGEQSPAWSEEDSPYYDDICEMLINLLYSETANVNKGAVQKDLDWLISLRPQNTWKPSDEQMKALKEAVDEHFDIDGGALWHLYEDLKKLRER